MKEKIIFVAMFCVAILLASTAITAQQTGKSTGKRTDTFEFGFTFPDDVWEEIRNNPDYQIALQYNRLGDDEDWKFYGGIAKLGDFPEWKRGEKTISGQSIPAELGILREGVYDFRIIGSSSGLSNSNFAFESNYLRLTFTGRENEIDVGLSSPRIKPSSPLANSKFEVWCPANDRGYDCIDAYSKSDSKCTWKGFVARDQGIKNYWDGGWSGDNSIFVCDGLPDGDYETICKTRTGTPDNCKYSQTKTSYKVVTSRLDLIISKAEILSNNKLQFTVANIGSDSASEFVIETKISDTQTSKLEFFAADRVGGMGPETSFLFNKNLFSLKPGKKTIEISVDANNDVIELNEDNNVKKMEFELKKEDAEFFCETVLKNGEPDKKLDVVFVPDGYTKDTISTFRQIVSNTINKFKVTEPFKQNMDKINFYRVETLQTFGTESYTDANFNGIKHIVTSCPGYDQIIVVNTVNTDKIQHTGYALLGYDIAVALVQIPGSEKPLYLDENEFIERVILHEFGHSFGELRDEYIYGFGPFYLVTGPNCDVKGCPKWCNDKPKSDADGNTLLAICKDIKNKDECGVDYEKNKACSWFDSADIKACTLDIDVMTRFDVGQNCIEGTGCYFGGCGGLGFKPTAVSMMSHFEKIYVGGKITMTEDSKKYNIPSIKHMKNLLDKYE